MKKFFKVRWIATVKIKREATVFAENENEARDLFDNGSEQDTRDIEELEEANVEDVKIVGDS